jgi:glycosyltransferase involved in cell wall biosynthesis
MPDQPAVSVIINAHREGLLAHRSVRSAIRAAEYAREQGVTVELIAVLDTSDEATLAYFQSQAAHFARLEPVDVDDLGRARNHGASCAAGRYLCFLDADDLFSQNWIAAAYQFAEAHPHDKLALHPELNLYFGDGLMLMPHADSTAPNFNPLSLIQYNYWTALVFISKALFEQHPYTTTDLQRCFGYEDWHFNCETLAAGIQHRPVPGTVHFIRRKPEGSLLSRTIRSGGTFRPSRLFDIASADTPSAADASAAPAQAPRTKKPVVRRVLSAAKRTLHPQRYRILCPKRLRPYAGVVVRAGFRACRGFGAEVVPMLRQLRCRHLLSDWLKAEWRSIHEIEPELFPGPHDLATIKIVLVPQSPLAQPYQWLSTTYGERATHVMLMPYLTEGGADLVAMRQVQAILDASPQNRVVFITTENMPSPWLSRLPKQVRVIELGRQLAGLSESDRELLLTRLLLQKKPEVIHCINSGTGFRMFIAKGAALKTQSRLYASAYADGFDPHGRRIGYVVDSLWRCFEHLSGVFTDNNTFRERLVDVYAQDPGKLFVAYSPVRVPEYLTSAAQQAARPRTEPYQPGRLRLLWVSRIAPEKRPDVLCQIAQALQDEPFEFHVYGQARLATSRHYVQSLEKLSNVTLHGDFPDFFQLPTDEMDVFVYTSQSDGIPNVLLEAMSAGLPIIAPNVGGIGELITDKTGFLVSGSESVDEYTAYLRAIRENYAQLVPERVSNAAALVANRHSPAAFLATLRSVPGYLGSGGSTATDQTGAKAA